MSSLSNFLGAPKEVEIETPSGKQKIILYPLKVKDLAKFSKTDLNDEEKTQMAKEILQMCMPDSTMDEINNLPAGIFTKLMKEVNILNGFEDEHAAIINKRIEQGKSRQANN